ncbi:MAG: sialidase family protein [Nitrosarchaeum sp.]
MANFHLAVMAILMFVLTSTFFVSFSFADQSFVNVSNTPGKSIRHQILVDGDLLYFVWEDHTYEKAEIFFAQSIDGGKNFQQAINLSNNNGTSLWPRLAVSENDIYVTWYDYTTHISEVFFSHSSDGGITFDTTNLSKDIGVSFNPWIAASGDNVYVVWMDDTPNYIKMNIEKPSEDIDVYFGNTDILLATSHDRGLTFEITNLSKNPVESSAPRIAVSGNNVYVAWIQATRNGNQVYFTKSNDEGSAFSNPKSVSGPETNANNAGILVKDDSIYVNWEGGDNKTNIFIAKSEDGGNSFSDPLNLSNSEKMSAKTRDTNMAFSKNNLYVVWTDGTTEDADVFFTRSIDKGNAFFQPINLSHAALGARYAQVVAHEQNVYVMWYDYRTGNSDVFFRSSNDIGETFGSIKNLSSDDAQSILSILGPHLAITPEGVFAGWASDSEQSNDIVMKFINHDSKQGVLHLETENNSVNIDLQMGQEKFVGKQTTFDLQFLNPETNQLLENVNYSFYIENSTGYRVFAGSNQFAENGNDTQTVVFSNTGPMSLFIEVHGLGQEQPFDIKYSGISSAIITVGQEFPFGILVFIVLVIILAIILLYRFKVLKF